jgi:hypothetical protein
MIAAVSAPATAQPRDGDGGAAICHCSAVANHRDERAELEHDGDVASSLERVDDSTCS